MNALKQARHIVETEPDSEAARALARLVVALESDADFPLASLYALYLETFSLTMKILDEWRLGRYYAQKGKLLDMAQQLNAQTVPRGRRWTMQAELCRLCEPWRRVGQSGGNFKVGRARKNIAPVDIWRSIMRMIIEARLVDDQGCTERVQVYAIDRALTTDLLGMSQAEGKALLAAAQQHLINGQCEGIASAHAQCEECDAKLGVKG